MPSPGDRVVFEGVKIGGGRREGQLVSVSGPGVTVKWQDGSQSFLIPGPGAMRIVAGGGSARRDSALRAGRTGTVRAKKAAKKARQVAVDRAVARTVTQSGTNKKTLSTPSKKPAKKKR